MRSYLPCAVACAVLVPLIAVSFAVWVVYYNRAIDTAGQSAQNYLTRTAADMQNRVQQYVDAAESINYILHGDALNHYSGFINASVDGSVFDKPNLLATLRTLGTSMPTHVTALRCQSGAGVFVGVTRDLAGALSYELSDDVASESILLFNITGAPGGTDTFTSLDAANRVQRFNVTAFDGRQRRWYRDAQTGFVTNLTRGWTDVYNISSLTPNVTLGISSWISYPLRTNANEFGGVCAAISSLTIVQQLLQQTEIGRTGIAALLSRLGTVIITSSPVVLARRMAQNATNPQVCDVPELAELCDVFQASANFSQLLPQFLPPDAPLKLFSYRRIGLSSPTANARVFAGASGDSDGFFSRIDLLRPRVSRGGTEVDAYGLDSGQLALVSPVKTDAFNGLFVLLGNTRDFDNGIRGQRDVAIIIGAIMLAIAAIAIAGVAYCFTRPLMVMTEVLNHMAAASASHSEKLEREGPTQILPQQEWQTITQLLYDDRTVTALCCSRSCENIVVGKFGGREVRRLHASLVQLVNNLSALAAKATEQESLRRKFIRYIFHEASGLRSLLCVDNIAPVLCV